MLDECSWITLLVAQSIGLLYFVINEPNDMSDFKETAKYFWWRQGQNIDGQNVDGQNIDGQNVDGQNTDARTSITSMSIRTESR